MRFMLTVRFGTQAVNTLANEGRIEAVLGPIMENLNPEAAYFGPIDGGRGAFLVVDIESGALLPLVADPFIQQLEATGTFVPVVTAADMA